MAKGIWKVLKVILMVIWKKLKIEHRKLLRAIFETVKQGKLESSAGKVFHIDFNLHSYEFSCKNSPNPMVRFEMAKNRHRYTPSCISLPTVIEDYMDSEYYTGKNGDRVSFSNRSPDGKVDRKAEEFIRLFRSPVSS